MTFRERYLTGQADFEELFDLTDEWNFSDMTCTLREFLGLTAEEEDIWITDSDDALEDFMEKEKGRKIFFTDLDDTLLNRSKEVTKANRNAIRNMLADGHIFCITTGRALASAKKIAKDLGFYGVGCYIISFNGGQIYDTMTEKIVSSTSVPMDLVRTCFDEAASFGIAIQTYSEDAVITEKATPNIEHYSSIQGIDWKEVPDVTTALNSEPAKMLALDNQDPDLVTRFRAHLAPLVEGKLDLFQSNANYLEIVPVGVNKGAAVHELCEFLCIPISNTVAAGDAENDAAMIKEAGVGCCMINGEDHLKEIADYVTTNDCDHDGVAEILEKFIL